MNEIERPKNSERSEGARSDRPTDDPTSAELFQGGNIETTIERDLAEARSKAASYLELAQRSQADFVNYKRRIEQERGEYARSARADIILRLLPAIDDLDLAVASLPADLAGTEWAQGIVLIDRKLKSSLDAQGVKPIDAVGKPFDPWQDEGVGHEPSTLIPPDSVTRVVRTGYSLDGKIIRPAQVLISSGPPERGSLAATTDGGVDRS